MRQLQIKQEMAESRLQRIENSQASVLSTVNNLDLKYDKLDRKMDEVYRLLLELTNGKHS